LKSKHPQYKSNKQYLFYLLNNANIRQLSRDIYHKLNITNLQDRYMASEYLEALHKDLLESNLSTIFSILRNTKQYWRKPRSEPRRRFKLYDTTLRTCNVVFDIES